MLSFKSFYKENNQVLRLYEDIEIEGVGTLKAMSDSGNSAFNVLDGRDVQINGTEVSFITTNKNIPIGSKSVVDTIKIHIGSGVNEDRPVVLFNIKFLGNEYKGVPFSIADRSDNDTPVLLGKEFFELLKNANKTDVLINVTEV
jgi:hypothetical protein